MGTYSRIGLRQSYMETYSHVGLGQSYMGTYSRIGLVLLPISFALWMQLVDQAESD
jgi:hypothetical protein